MIVLNSVLLACECFFGGSLVLALALALCHGKPASQRHLLLTGGFAVLLALPLASLALPSHLVWVWTAAAPTAAPVSAMPVATASVFDLTTVVFGLALVWAMGVIFVLSKAAFGGVTLAALYGASVPHIPHGIAEEKFRGLNWQLRLRTTPGEAGPITWGILRPVVLLPKSSVTWSRARLEAVLLHEAAHVRRYDCLSRLIAVLACALYWPNPLVWTAARIMRRDGETAADDVVLSSGIKASAYAEHLVGLARVFAAARPCYAGVSLAMAEPAMLEARVEAILHPTRSRQALRRNDVVKIALLGLTATAVMALARPSVAEAKPQAKAVVAAAAPSQQSAPLRLLAADVPALPAAVVPPEPPAAVVPPAPPEPAGVVVPPEPPAAVVPPEPPAPPAHLSQRWERPVVDRAEVARAVAAAAEGMREHAADFAQAQADIAKAHAEIAKAQATVHAALAKANISAIVSQALDKAFHDLRHKTDAAATVKAASDDE